jgi:hypothetical protein
MADLVTVSNYEIYGKALIVKGKNIFHNYHFLSSSIERYEIDYVSLYNYYYKITHCRRFFLVLISISNCDFLSIKRSARLSERITS